jgi:hypothetical protein
MRHLAPNELIDLAEGTRAESSAPHVTQCATCRDQLAELRATLRLAVGADVPEPSPLFWDHLSARVRTAIVEEAPRPRVLPFGLERLSWRFVAAAGAVAAAIVVTALSIVMRSSPARTETASIAPAASGVVSTPLAQAPALRQDDPSLELLGDLAGQLDWDAAADAGMMVASGAADGAVLELTDAERVELRRLLREAMAGA